MSIQSLSLVIGTRACDASCPFCISKMTGFSELKSRRSFHKQRLNSAIKMAQNGGCNTVLLTGKGEPTLYPSEVTSALSIVGSQFPLVELQTNGLRLYDSLCMGKKISGLSKGEIERWMELGLSTISISIVHYDDEDLSKKVYRDPYMHLRSLVKELRSIGFTIRLSVVSIKGGIENFESLQGLLNFAQMLDIAQVTIRPVASPDTKAPTFEKAASDFVETNKPCDFFWNSNKAEGSIFYVARTAGTLLRTLEGGGEVYDIDGQNLCLYNCLTTSGEKKDIRSLIVYPNGQITYSWQYKGAVILDSIPE